MKWLTHQSGIRYGFIFGLLFYGLCMISTAWGYILGPIYVNDNNIPEDSKPGETVGYLLASDGSAIISEDPNFTLFLTTEFEKNYYALKISDTFTIDYESTANDSHTYVARMIEQGKPRMVTVDLGDVNEPPIISSQSLSLTENSAIGTKILTISASDPDYFSSRTTNLEYVTLTYRIESGNLDNTFSLNSETGDLSIAGIIDYEKHQSFNLTVSVSDIQYSATATIAISVINLNDNAPQLVDQAFSIGKVVPLDTVIMPSPGQVDVSDADGDPITLSILSGNTNDAFVMNKQGVIKVYNAIQIANSLNTKYDLVLAADDGTYTSTATITIHVDPNNYRPTISNITNKQTVDKPINIPFTISDSNGEVLGIVVSSSNSNIVPDTDDNLKINGFGRTYNSTLYSGSETLTLTVIPSYFYKGTASITIRVSDDEFITSRSFDLKVSEGVTPPEMSQISSIIFNENSINNTIPFSVYDADWGPLTITVNSSNPTLLPTDGVHLKYNNADSSTTTTVITSNNSNSLSLVVTPVSTESGSSILTLTVKDISGRQFSRSFTVTITPGSNSPNISQLVNSVIPENTLGYPISFTVADADGGQSTITVSSDDINLIPNAINNLKLEGATNQYTVIHLPANESKTLTLYVTPISNKIGVCHITLSITDKTNRTDSSTSTLTVNSVPVIAGAGGKTTYHEGTPIQVATISSITDVDNATLASASVTFSDGFYPLEDRLLFTDTPSITSQFNTISGILTLTGTTSLADYKTALNNVMYDNLSDNPTLYTRTLIFKVFDGANESLPITQTIGLVVTNDAPIITGIGGTTSYLEDSTTAIVPDLVITDPDSILITRASIQISHNYTVQDDFLVFTDTLYIFGTWNAGTLSLSGTDTMSNYQAALRAVKYQNYSNNPTPLTRTITLTVFDGGANSLPVTQAIQIVPVNDVPSLTGAGGTTHYTENSASVIIADNISMTDVDSQYMAFATIAFSKDTYTQGKDLLSFENMHNIRGEWDSSQGALLLSGEDDKTIYSIALNRVKYSNLSDNPAAGQRIIYFSVNDGQGSHSSNMITQLISVHPVNDAPLIGGGGGTTVYTENTAIAIATNITLSDIDSPLIPGATIQFTIGYQPTEDRLFFSDTVSITSTWVTETGTLTLSGSDTLLNYQTALRQVQYDNLSDNPLINNRSISFWMTDGMYTAGPIIQQVSVIRVNDAPSFSNTGVVSYTENSSTTAIASAVSLTDPDHTTIKYMKLWISQNYQQNEDSLVYDGLDLTSQWHAQSGTLELSGTASIATYETALQSIRYMYSSDDPIILTRTVLLSASDGQDMGAGVPHIIQIIPVNDPPVTGGVVSPISYTENETIVIANQMTLSDLDNTHMQSAKLVIDQNYEINYDQLVFPGYSTIIGTWTSQSATLSLSGIETIEAYQTALRLIQFTHLGDNPSSAPRQISITVFDSADNSVPITQTINMIPINDPSILTAVGITAYTENDLPVSVIPDIQLIDPDNTTIHHASVRISSGYQMNEDVLIFTGAGNIMSNWVQATGELQLTGIDTLTAYENALQQISYENTSEWPMITNRIITFVVNDHTADSNSLTRTIILTPVNDPPVLSGASQILYFSENSLAIPVAPQLSITDVDHLTLQSAVISITPVSPSRDTMEDILAFENTENITSTWNKTLATLTLQGQATIAEYQQALQNVTYINVSDDPSIQARFILFQAYDGIANSLTITQTIRITAINDPPVIQGSSNVVLFPENGEAVILESGLTVIDPDDRTMRNATVWFTSGYVQGQDLIKLSGGEIGSMDYSWNAESGIFTIWGTDYKDIYIAALKSIAYQHTSDNPGQIDKQIAFTINDSKVSSVIHYKTIRMVPENDPPVLAKNEGITVREGASVTITNLSLAVTDPDDLPQTIYYWVTQSPQFGTLYAGVNPIIEGYTFTQFDINALQFVYRHDGSETTFDSFSYTVSDQEGESLTGTTFQITISSVNIAPIILSDPILEATEDILYTYQVIVHDPDDMNNGLDLHYALTDAPTGMTISTTGLINWTPLETVLSAYVTVQVTDGGEDGSTASKQSYTITVTPVNDSPQIIVNTGVIIQEALDVVLSPIQLAATDVESDDLLLQFVITQLPFHGTLYADSQALSLSDSFSQQDLINLKIRYQHDGSESSTDGFRFIVRDPELTSSLETPFMILVQPMNDPPILTGAGGYTAYSENYTLIQKAIKVSSSIAVSDADHLSLSHARVWISNNYVSDEDILTMPLITGLETQWDTQNGILSISGAQPVTIYQTALRSVQYSKLKNANIDPRIISFQVFDTVAGSNVQSQTVVVTPVEEPPVISSVTDQYIYGDTPTLPIVMTIVDPEGGTLNISSRSSDSSLFPKNQIIISGVDSCCTSIHTDPGQLISISLIVLPASGAYGSATITVSVSDETGFITQSAFMIHVEKFGLSSMSGPNGHIDPEGVIKVTNGEPFVTFRMIPDVGFTLDKLWVDNQIINPVSVYTFWAISDHHAISATFKQTQVFVINSNSWGGGVIEPSGQLSLSKGASQSFTIKPNTGYEIQDVRIDGKSVGAVANYTFQSIQSDHSIVSTFAYVPKPIAKFSVSSQQGIIPHTVSFIDESQGGITTWAWDFGDGQRSSRQNPVHTYEKSGDFTIRLTVKGPSGESFVEEKAMIHVSNTRVDFSTDTRIGVAPVSIFFSNLSQGNSLDDIWSWNFGDGTVSTLKNPEHTFSQPGMYDITLTATINGNDYHVVKPKFITITGRSIQGKVMDRDTNIGIAGCMVEAWLTQNELGGTAITDSEGNFTMTQLPAQSGIKLAAWPSNTLYYPGFYEDQDRISLATPVSTSLGNITQMTIRLTPSSTLGIMGQIIDELSQEAVRSYSVDIFSESALFAIQVSTDDQGRYTATGLKPASDYRISVWSSDYEAEYFYAIPKNAVVGQDLPSFSVLSWTEATSVQPTDPMLNNINIIMGHQSSISGLVTVEGQPIQGVWVKAWSDAIQSGHGAFSTETGAYTITGLPATANGIPLTYIVDIPPLQYPYQAYPSVSVRSSAMPVTAGRTDIHFVLPKGVSVTGLVKDAYGIPVQGAEVLAWSYSDSQKQGTAITDSHGRFTFSSLPIASDYIISVFSTYYPLQYYGNTLDLELAQQLDLRYGLNKDLTITLGGMSLIRGTVFIESMDYPGANGIWVNIWSESTQTGGEIPTDANGRFELTGLNPTATDYIISIFHEEYIPAYYNEKALNQTVYKQEDAQGISPSNVSRPIVLNPGLSISGQVTVNGKPFRGATVSAFSEETHGWGESQTSDTLTNDMNYKINGLPSGSYSVRVSAPGYEDQQIDYVALNATVNHMNFKLSPPQYAISGVINGLESGKQIRLHAQAVSIQHEKVITLTGTGYIMAYSITGLKAANDYRVEVLSADYGYQAYNQQSQWHTATLIPVNAIVTGIDFVLVDDNLESIEGSVIAVEASPGEIVWIDAFSANVGTGKGVQVVLPDTGAIPFRISGLIPSDDYIVSAWSSRYLIQYYNQVSNRSDALKIDLSQGSKDGMHFVLSTGSTISGFITENAVPKPGIQVCAWAEKTGALGGTVSDSQGFYMIEGFEPTDSIVVKAVISGIAPFYYHSSQSNIREESSAQRISLLNGSLSHIDISIYPGEQIGGRITTDSGKPVSGVWVTAWSDTTKTGNHSLSQSDGTFLLMGLPHANDYQLTITPHPSTGYVFQRKDAIATNTQGVRFILTNGYKLAGVITGQNGETIANTHINLWSEAIDFQTQTQTDINGAYQIQSIPPSDDYALIILPENKNYANQTIQSFVIHSHLNFSVALLPGMTISGHVYESDGETPISQLRVAAYGEGSGEYGASETNNLGYYEITNLPTDENYRVITISDSYFEETKLADILHSTIDFILSSAGQISGSVRDDSFQPIGNIRIEARSASLNNIKSTVTNDMGNFTLTGLKHSQTNDYIITVYGDSIGYPIQSKGGKNIGDLVPFILTRNKTNELSGTIKDANGSIPPSNATIYIRMIDSSGQFIGKVLADQNGVFLFQGLDSKKQYALRFTATNTNLSTPIQWANSQAVGTENQEQAGLFSSGSTIQFRYNGVW